MHPIAALGPVSTSMNSTALPRNPAVLFLVTFIKVSLQQYKTLHVTLSLIICVMDHCSRAKTRALSGGTLIGSNSPSSPSPFPFVTDTPSGKDDVSTRIWRFEWMIMSFLHVLLMCNIYFTTKTSGPNESHWSWYKCALRLGLFDRFVFFRRRRKVKHV